MIKNEKSRGYKLSLRTCREIDYLNLITDKEKAELISEAVDFSFALYTLFPDEVREGLVKLSSDKSEEELLGMIKETLLRSINDDFLKELL